MPKSIPTSDQLVYWVEKYIVWREEYSPDLPKKKSWTNRRNLLRSFSHEFISISITQLSLPIIRKWWENLTYHQQHGRRAEFNKLFNYLAGQNLIPLLEFNPFTSMDDRPRLIKKTKPVSKRMRLPREHFWIIYDKAGELGYKCLQIAMGISLVTSMRREDVCTLKFDEHISTTSLRKTINKSEAQRGAISASHLEFNFADHPLLTQLVNQAKVSSLNNMGCPYLISHRPQQKRMGKTKTHVSQVTGDRLGKMFEQVRDETNLYRIREKNKTPPTFHEIRALSSHMFKNSGYDVKSVQEVMAHTDPRVTMGYQAGHNVQFKRIEISISKEQIGRGF